MSTDYKLIEQLGSLRHGGIPIFDQLYTTNFMLLNMFRNQLFYNSCLHNNLTLAKHITRRLSVDFKDYARPKFDDVVEFNILNDVCKTPNVELKLITWLYSILKFHTSKRKIVVDTCWYLLPYMIDRIDLIEFLLEIGAFTTSGLFHLSDCSLDVFRLLYRYYESYINENIKFIFKRVLKSKHKELINYLLNEFPYPNIELLDEHYVIVCEMGDLKYIQWFIDVGFRQGVTFNLNGGTNNIIVRVARDGHFDIAKWLYYKSVEIGKPIDIHTERDYVLRFLYENRRPETVDFIEWLVELGKEIGEPFDLFQKDHQLFRCSCEHMNFDLMCYLVQQFPEIYIINGHKQYSMSGKCYIDYEIRK
jgi:hypothetical protein